MRKSLLLCIIPLCICCYNKGTNNHVSTSDNVSIIDLDKDYDKDVSIFDFCNTVEIVELENDSESLVSEEGTICFAYGDTSFFVLGKEDYLLKEFDYNGKLLSITNKFGRGPGEFSMAQDMIINKFSNTLDILNPMGLIYKYDLNDMSWVETIDISNRIKAVHYLAALSSDRYILYSLSDSPRLFIYSISENSFHPLDVSIPTWLTMTSFCGGGSPFYQMKEQVKFVIKYDGTICEVGEDYFAIDKKWDLGKYTFSPDLVEPEKDYFYYSDLLNRTTRKFATTFTRTAESPQYLIQNFRFKSPFPLNSVLYDKRNNKVKWFRKTKENVYVLAVIIRNGTMYYVFNSEIRDLLVNERILSDELSIETYKRLTDESNAVLIKYTLNNNE